MAVSKARKAAIKQEISEWLDAGGGDHDVEQFRSRYQDISRATFYRYLKDLRLGAGRRAAQATVEHAQKLRDENVERTRQETMPVAVTPDVLTPLTDSNALEIVGECIGMARRAAEHCQAQGRIRNLKSYMQAGRNLLAAVETLTRVSERLYDMQRVEQLHAAIFEEINKADPQTADRILKRIQRLQQTWGGGAL